MAKKLTGKALFEQLEQLPEIEQKNFLSRMMDSTGFLAYWLNRWRTAQTGAPIKRGKPERDAQILEACKTMSDGQVARKFGISSDAVQGVRRRNEMKKR